MATSSPAPAPSTSRTLYFAYGSNMDIDQMAVRCPEAELVGRAELPRWRFAIDGRGVATIRPRRHAVTHGLLWALTPASVASLDRYEGVENGWYVPVTLVVAGESGPVSALVYLSTDGRNGVPREGYLERIVAAARAAGLPETYVAELALHLAEASV